MRTYVCGKNRMTRVSLDPIERVLARSVLRSSGCIEWTGLVNRKGYGVVYSGHKQNYCHRVAYEHASGAIPAGTHVLHKCDNPACVRPEHLFLGTNADNIEDKVRKDRSGKKLRIADVVEIHALLDAGHTQKEIAAMYGIHQSNVGRIRSGEKWAHVHNTRGAAVNTSAAVN